MESGSLKKSVYRLALVTLAIALVAGGYAYHKHPLSAEVSAGTMQPVAMGGALRNTPAGLPEFSAIVERQGPAVVNISVSGIAKTGYRDNPGMDPDDPFYDFFRHFQIPRPQGGIPIQGLGSGFIVSPDGVILTNAHVVANADEVTVKLTDKREFRAKVLGMDKPSDVAVLKIDAKGLPTVTIGDPQRTRVGEWVLAIGSPFGFENSVTAGIVSAKSRSLPDEGYVPFLQTDVAINPGNSGGPLFNLNGEVIGVNSQIYSRSGGYQGLSFAIPIDVAMKVEKQLVDHGKVSRGRLGVSIQEVNPQLADAFGLAAPAGALVSSVESGSPAEKAGIKAGDVILKFAGQAINRSADLPPLVADITPGTSVKLEVWREGKSKEISISVGAMQTADSRDSKASDEDQGPLGLALRPLAPEERRQARLAGGLLVEDVAGTAARAGIRPGDVLIAANGTDIGNVGQLRSVVARAGKHLALLIQRDDRKIFIPIDIS